MRTAILLLVISCLLAACRTSRPTASVPTEPVITRPSVSVPAEPAVPHAVPAPAPRVEPDRVTVDHILIPVTNPDMPPERAIPTVMDEADARTLAYDLLARLRDGADWDALKREHSADPPPGGPYRLANHGVAPADRNEFKRAVMVSGFGDVGFALEVGEIGMADFDREKSKFGFHIIRRVE